jgi:hypothetical protein
LAQSPFSNILAAQWKAGAWKVDPTHDTLFTTGNAGVKMARAAITIYYNSGQQQYHMPEVSLAPGEQTWVDIGKLIAGRVPDKDGHTIPLGTTTGSYEIRDVASPLIGQLYEAKVITDLRFGHATYGCAACCAPWHTDGAWMDPLTLGVGDNGFMPVYGTNACTGNPTDVTNSMSDWDSFDTTIATGGPTIYGVAAGSTYFYAGGSLTVANDNDVCVWGGLDGDGGVNVAVPTQVEPISTTSQGYANCSVQGQNGWVRNVTNQLQDQFGGAYLHTGLTMADTITYPVNNAFGINGTQTGSYSTGSNSTSPDTYYVCTTACPGSSAEVDAQQSWTYNGNGLTHANLVVYKCTSIAVDGN